MVADFFDTWRAWLHTWLWTVSDATRFTDALEQLLTLEVVLSRVIQFSFYTGRRQPRVNRELINPALSQ